MAFSITTGLAEYITGTGSLLDALDAGEIKIYSGTVPASAEAALGSATLLCTILLNGTNPLSLDVDGRKIIKPAAAVWNGVPVASGTATFFRHVMSGDTGTASTSGIRTQGAVGTTNAAEMPLFNPTLTTGVTHTLHNYVVEIPLFK